VALGIEAAAHTIALDHSRSEENPEETCSVNVASTWRLLNRLSQTGTKRFVYFSTQQIYGRTGAVRITEDMTPAPINAYGLSHWMSEQVCDLFNRRSQTLCAAVRISNGFGAPVFGSTNCWWLVINDFCKSAMESGVIRLTSDGTPQRDFVHIADVCQAVEQLLTRPAGELLHRVYNVGSGQTQTILELAHRVQGVCKRLWRRDIPVVLPDGTTSQGAERHREIPRFSYDVARLRGMGWESTRSLEDGIGDVLAFLGANKAAIS
jgi:UDP-glucose 4-epimerase